ncbi:DNA translocase FtsK [Beijerinckiaceae bacterium RH AL1]|nr:DNA translocase FtsK [Beijerinckiaceae bacterium RH CH11]VVB49510.1 DNA translocase FtsK [Beijerinckiaceae bacterium RH AL8]VVC56898.1 DNA translocase FtsK [Beijerinckiaceae bacterium RH AL1]
MPPSTSRAIPARPREGRLREAGLSSARALSRLIVALIENLRAQDEVGRRAEPSWPHGTRLSAFGPTPLGAEIERAARKVANPLRVQEVLRDDMTGRPVSEPFAPPRQPAEVPRAPAPTQPTAFAPPPPDQAPEPQPAARASFTPPKPTPAPRDPPPWMPEDETPSWQKPFQALPGVRYVRTPDHLLRRARENDVPIAPITGAEASEAFEIAADPEPIAPFDQTVDLVDDDAFDGPEFDFTDEVADLSIEERVAFEMRRGLPWRLRMTSGLPADAPQPANDLARALAATLAPAVEATVPKQPFAVAVRAKPKATVAAPEASVVAVAAASSRVTLAAGSAPKAAVRPTAFEWEYPSVDLLAEPRKPEGTALTAEMLEQNARLLESTLEDFGIRGEIIHVRAGPVVTLYELEPAPGVKSSRVIGLADDIARSMSALSARVAVVPGRNAIGIELPNERRETVYFREMIESEAYGDSKHKLAIALGKTIGGEPVVAELAKMPHLLVAGTTGSGKSVAINTMILSLLYRLKPEECRLIMVDPKMLELSVYDGIPHLLTPVVTDPKKAVVALKWAVREMEDRYKKMSKVGVRNIDGFNTRVAEATARGETIMMQVTTGYDRDTGKPTTEEQAMDLAKLPYIVVIVDEMADLMMVAGKDIEGAIQRLAQMARAAGIHLIMATQRPSVDVITGTIKANFPTRISFQVTSKIDSRTILGEQGAEQLLGQGDMLHMQGGGRIYRVHGPFVSDDEVEKVVAHLKTQGQPDYLDSVTDDVDGEAADEGDEDGGDAAVFDKTAMGAEGDDGSLYEQAVKVVLRDKKSSVSYVQRRLQVGYNKAASLIERMEKEGILGPASHTGKREILAHSRARVITGVPVAADDED